MKQSTKLIGKLIGTVALLGATAISTPALADTKDFKAGSLIIPATSVFQTDCGAVSMYGLIYNILRANAWLDADPGYGPIEVYYAYNTTKTSPNRCTPTNKHSRPTVSATWEDGCDFSISDSTGTTDVVSLVNNKLANADSTITTINTNGKVGVYPTYNLAQAITSADGVNTVRYSGGAFIIDKSDADTFLGLLRGTIPAKDNGVTLTYDPWKLSDGSGNPTACNFQLLWGSSTVGGWVNIHRSLVDFTAPVPKLFNANPPRLALLALDTANSTGTLSNGILQGYLSRAGLTFPGAAGCPTNSPHKSVVATCPNSDNSGEIYDTFDFKDVLDGSLDPAKYKMFWAPHWQLDDANNGGSTNERKVITKISTFLEGKTGVMAECASIESFEGSTNAQAGGEAKFQTCRNNSGSCSGTLSTRGFQVNSGGGFSADPKNVLRNCSDINMAGNSDCFYISYPTDPYVQIGDYNWYAGDGVVADFLPKTSSTVSIYKPGVLPLISGVTALNISLLGTPAAARSSGLIKGDYVSRNQKDAPLTTKGNILYLGGHDLTVSVSGTKVALQTLLQLGTPDVTTFTAEISRATPIIALVSGVSALVQGTYESIQPVAGNPTTMTIDSQATTFRFPFIKGHLRAYTNVTTTATRFDTLGASAAWDATTLIPPATYTGCSTSYTAGCRTVFTNLDQNCRRDGTPCTNTVFSDSTAAALGVVMANDLSATSKTTLVRRTLEGVEDLTVNPNHFKARIGGIDRSTVAVIPESSLAGLGARPTMIYAGAGDGMIHAICGDNVAPCDTAGRELWAFMPRNQLAAVRNNETRIDGSVRVQDMYGDFDGSGKSFRTILVFQSSPSTTGVNAVYALDVTFPGAPTILWEHTTAGNGLSITMGKISSGKLAAFVQTNSGTTTAGTEVRAIDLETGLALWTKAFTYPAPRTVARTIPSSGIPGGAVAVDISNSGTMTDVVFTTLYGDIFRLDALTGDNPYDPNPLFRFGADLKPFGASPALFSSGQVYAVAASGGYLDYDTDTEPLWTSSSTMQQAVAVALNTPVADVPLTEATTPSANGLKFKYDLGAGQLAYSQAQVIGDQIFLTSDTTDVNATTYGTGGNTGEMHRIDMSGGNASVVAIMGGAASIGRSGVTTYAATGSTAQQLSLAAGSDKPTEGVNGGQASKVTRRLWLRTL